MSGRIKKYLIFAKSGAQTTLAYRGMVFLWFLGGIINVVVMCLLWHAIYNFSPDDAINGYTYPQMIMYVILSAVVGELTYSDTMGLITDDVRDGVIGMRLMKPVSYRAQLMFNNIGSFAARMLFIGLPMLTAGTLIGVFGFGFTGLRWYNVLLFVPAVFLAVLFADSIGFLFGQLAFRTQAMFGVSSIMQTVVAFLSGAVIPLAMFPEWAQTALYFTPFPSMMSMPIRLFMGGMTALETLEAFGISIAWLIVLNVIGGLLYKSSVRHVVVFGG